MSPEKRGTISFIDGAGDVIDFSYYDVSDITEEKNNLRIVVGDTIYAIPLLEPQKADSGIRVTDGNNIYEISTVSTDMIESFESSDWFDNWETMENSFGEYGRTKSKSIDGSYSFYHTGDTGNFGFAMKKSKGDHLVKEGEIISSYIWSGKNSEGVVPNLSLGVGDLSPVSISGEGIYSKFLPSVNELHIQEYDDSYSQGYSKVSVSISSDTWYKMSFLYDPGNHKAKLYELDNNNIGNNIATVSYNGSTITGDRHVWLDTSGYGELKSKEKSVYFDYIKREGDFVNY